MSLTIGLVQADYGIDPLSNYEKTKGILKKSYRKADLIVLPEYSMSDPLQLAKPEEIVTIAEYIEDSIYLSKLSELAAELGASILAHFIEKTSSEGKPLSSSVMIHPSGGIEKLYSKIHLFDAYGYRESLLFERGKNVSRSAVIKGIVTNIAICFDIRFPELFRVYARTGSELVIVHSGWVKDLLKEESLEFLLRSRAHENTFWVAAANRWGKRYVGRSMVIDPFGVKVFELSIGESYGEYTIDRSRIYEARKILPIVELSKNLWKVELMDLNKVAL
ncbi:MAG: nitrilase-related carbon-nitrogen hydrolase [Desulfurococcaceae archaeon]